MSKSLRYSNISHDESLLNERSNMIPSEKVVKEYVDSKIKKIKIPKISQNKKLKVEIKDIESQISPGKKGEIQFGEKGIYVCIYDNFWEIIKYNVWENLTIVGD